MRFLDWIDESHLVVVGEFLSIWETSQKLDWSGAPTRAVWLCSFFRSLPLQLGIASLSPDRKYLATSSALAHDLVIRIYKLPQISDYCPFEAQLSALLGRAIYRNMEMTLKNGFGHNFELYLLAMSSRPTKFEWFKGEKRNLLMVTCEDEEESIFAENIDRRSGEANIFVKCYSRAVRNSGPLSWWLDLVKLSPFSKDAIPTTKEESLFLYKPPIRSQIKENALFRLGFCNRPREAIVSLEKMVDPSCKWIIPFAMDENPILLLKDNFAVLIDSLQLKCFVFKLCHADSPSNDDHVSHDYHYTVTSVSKWLAQAWDRITWSPLGPIGCAQGDNVTSFINLENENNLAIEASFTGTASIFSGVEEPVIYGACGEEKVIRYTPKSLAVADFLHPRSNLVGEVKLNSDKIALLLHSVGKIATISFHLDSNDHLYVQNESVLAYDDDESVILGLQTTGSKHGAILISFIQSNTSILCSYISQTHISRLNELELSESGKNALGPNGNIMHQLFSDQGRWLLISFSPSLVSPKAWHSSTVASNLQKPLAWRLSFRGILYIVHVDGIEAYIQFLNADGNENWVPSGKVSWPNNFPRRLQALVVSIEVDQNERLWVTVDGSSWTFGKLDLQRDLLAASTSQTYESMETYRLWNKILACKKTVDRQDDADVSKLSSERITNELSFFSDEPSDAESTNSSGNSADDDSPAVHYTQGIDAFGEKFTLLAEDNWKYSYSLKTHGLEFLFASASDAQELLVSHIRSLVGENLTWESFSQFGIGYWVRNQQYLRLLLEEVARNDFAKNRDPHFCSIVYLFLGRLTVLKTLWRDFGEEGAKFAKFLKSDFSDAAVKTIAAKNAFVALGKQQYSMAIILFLLAGHLGDATQVCFVKMEDFHLGFLLCRLLCSKKIEFFN